MIGSSVFGDNLQIFSVFSINIWIFLCFSIIH